MGLYTYHPKHFTQVKNHPLSGITLRPWLRLLGTHWRAIDFHLYGLRVMFLTFMAILNSCTALVEWWRHAEEIDATALHPSPIFILGHPRTGTTHLHNLLSQDKRFAFCCTFHVGFPSSFLTTEWLSWLLSPLLSSTRPMDQMALSWITPQEDELGTCQLSGGVSPYMPLMFMRDEAQFRPLFALAEDAPAAARAEWERCFLLFLRKVTLRCGGGKPLLIKSPVHTARVPLLLRLFPEARFVYLHRDPYQVFQSATHMADAYYWYSYLQRPTDEQITEWILWQYEHLYDRYMAARALIRPSHLMEIAFAELDARPLQVLRRVYEHFELGDFDKQKQYVERYMGSLSAFKKNAHVPLTAAMVDAVNSRWGASFDAFGYQRR